MEMEGLDDECTWLCLMLPMDIMSKDDLLLLGDAPSVVVVVLVVVALVDDEVNGDVDMDGLLLVLSTPLI